MYNKMDMNNAPDSKKRILVVDDEARIRDLLRIVLESRGYDVTEADDGADAVAFVAEEVPDMVILDVMMPVMDGFTACRQIRKVSDCPVLMLTAKGEDYDQVEGFECGADDYVVKPFTPMVLAARVQALLRRNTVSGSHRESFGKLKIDTDARGVWVNGKPVSFNRKEYDLLIYLTENHNISLSRDQILESVWGYDYLGSTGTVDTHINRLRSKLGECGAYIQTLRGYGYKFEVKQ